MKISHSISNLPTLGLVSLTALALTACGEKAGDDGSDEGSASASLDPKIESVFLSSEPGGALSVIEARKRAEPGTALTVTGRIAGAMEPFSADYATFVLADESLMTCERNPGDSCQTPWDACCVDPKDIAASRLTVQILGEDGRPIDRSLKSVHDLAELDTLVVTGTVADGSSEQNLILNADGIFPKPEKEGKGS